MVGAAGFVLYNAPLRGVLYNTPLRGKPVTSCSLGVLVAAFNKYEMIYGRGGRI